MATVRYAVIESYLINPRFIFDFPLWSAHIRIIVQIIVNTITNAVNFHPSFRNFSNTSLVNGFLPSRKAFTHPWRCALFSLLLV